MKNLFKQIIKNVEGMNNASNARSVVITFVATVCLLFALPQGAKAEEREKEYTAVNGNAPSLWKAAFPTTDIVSITYLNNDAGSRDGKLRIAGSDGTGQTGYMTFSAQNNTYIHTYQYTGNESQNAGYAYFNDGYNVTTASASSYKLKLKGQSNQNRGPVTLDKPSTNIVINDAGSGGCSPTYVHGDISYAKFVVWIPEVKPDASSNYEANYPVSEVIKTTGTATSTQSVTVNVSEAIAVGDFEAAWENKVGKGTFSTPNLTLSADKKTLTVTFTYTSASGTSWQDGSGYSADLVISSQNTINDKTYTYHVSGAATDQKPEASISWKIGSTLYVGDKFDAGDIISTNSAGDYSFTTSMSEVAYIDDYQGLSILKDDANTITITVKQVAAGDYGETTRTHTFSVSKRTATFTFNPYGANEALPGTLFTGQPTYTGFITQTTALPVLSAAKYQLPELTYTLDTENYLSIDASGNATTKLSAGTTHLTITGTGNDAWNDIHAEYDVVVVKDPKCTELCLSTTSVYVDLTKGSDFLWLGAGSEGNFTWASNQLKIGDSHDKYSRTTNVMMHFEGAPDKLQITYNSDNSGTLTIKQSADGSSWGTTSINSTSTSTSSTTNDNIQLNEATRYLQITYSGIKYIYFSKFCITAKSTFSVPSTVQLTQSGGVVLDEIFNVSQDNIKQITITSSNPHFTVSPSTLAAAQGLGYGHSVIPITVSFAGSDETETATLTLSATTMDDVALTSKTIAVSIIHPTHYVQGIARVGTGWGKVHIATDATVPDASAYVGGGSAGVGATMSTAVLNCGATGEGDTKTFTLRAMPDNTWQFAEWQDQAGNFLSGDNPYVANATALSADAAHPTQYTYKAIFFKGFNSAPVFRLENLNLADTKSGQSVGGTLVVEGDPSGRPKYIVANEVSVSFEDIAGHTGEAAKFSAGTYNKGTHSFPITFDPRPNKHLTDRTYQAKAVVTATNDEFDENGDFLQKRTTTHECLVTVVCHPADMASFNVPDEIDFGYVEQEASWGRVLTMTNIENMEGDASLTLSNTIFTNMGYGGGSFSLGYTFHAGQEGLLTATATVTARNYDDVEVSKDVTLKVVANKPQFEVSNLSMGSMVSGDEPISAYLPLGNLHGADPSEITITITDSPGHAGESAVFSSLDYDESAEAFYITFAPVGAHVDDKAYQAQATISATNLVGTTTVTVLINATVLTSAPATFDVEASHNFGSLQRNQSAFWNVELTNISNAGEELPSISFTGTNAEYFSAEAYDPVNHRFTVKFTPLAVNPSCSATAHVVVKNFDGKPTEKTITLTGTCVPAPAASFDVQNSDNESVVGTGVYFGDFNVGDAATRTLYIANLLNIKEGTVPAVSISPEGKFAAAAYNATTKSFDITFTALEGMETVQNAVATFTVLNNDDQVTEKTVPLSAFVVKPADFDVRVTSAGGGVLLEGSWADGLAEANKPANAGCTVTLMRAVTGLTAYQEIKNTFTLDLNGKKLSGKNNGSIIYVNGAGKTLTIKDSKSDGRIENINNTFPGIAYGVNVTAGSLMLHSGTIYVENNGASGRKAVGILNKLNTNVTINGGKVEVYGYNDSYGIYQGSDAGDNMTFTMNNGEVTIEGATNIMGVYARGNVNINGGVINATATSRYSFGIRLYATANATATNCVWGKLNMTGGTINSTCNSDANAARETYGVYFDCSNAAMGTSTATDGSHANKAAAIGTISNATINATTYGNTAYGIIAYGSYNSKTNTYDVIRVNNSTINATAKYYNAYGVYATGGVDATNNVTPSGTTGAVYFANVELTDCEVNATVNTYTTAYAVWATTGSGTIYKDKQPNYYGEYAGGATVTINSGTYTATTGTTNAYAAVTSTRSKTIYDSETSVYAERTLGGNAEGYATLNIHGGTFRANAGTTTARAVSNGGNCTIDGGEFYATTGTSTAYGLYTVSGKLKATGIKVDVTAGTGTAYGIVVDVAGAPTGNQAWTGFTYAGDAELNNLDVTVKTSTATEARGVFVNATTTTYTRTAFENQKTSSKWADATTYAAYNAVFPGDKAYASAGKVVINGGKYTINAATTTAYGVYLAQTSVSANKSAIAAAEATIKNATFDVSTNGTTYAYGIRSGGDVTIDGCNIKVQPKTTTAYGVYMDNNTATITNTTLDVKGTTTAYALYANASINSTNGYDYHGRFDLGAGNDFTAAATAGNTAHVMTLIAAKRNIASGDFAGDYANAATAVIRDGKYKATATGTTTYVLNLSANQVQGAVSAAPSCTIEGGKFWAAATGGTQGVCTANGVKGNILLQGGVYNINTNLSSFLAPGYDEVPIESGRAEYTEGYRYEILPSGPHGNYVCQIGSTKYKTLEEALSVVTSGQTIYMIANYTLPAGDYILPSGATLLIPYTTSSGKGGTTAIGAAAVTTTSATTPTLFRKLTFASGANLTSFGTIETSAQQKANGQYGANVGMASGPYGQLDLKEGSHIEMENGANLYCWGFVTGKGTINVKKGANTLEGFQLGDWCGGTNASNLIGNSQKVFPITHYFFQSIECPITYRPGSTAKGSTHINVSFFGVVGQDAVSLVGTSGAMFLMTNEDASADTWVMRDYDETTDQSVWTLNSGASIGNLTINISSYNMASKDYDLPIASNMSIVMNYGTMSIGQNAVFLPGSKLIVNKEGTLDINGVSVVAYDTEDWTGTTRYYASYSPSWGTTNPRKNIALQDAEFFVHGKINIRGNGGVYTSAGGANIHSTNADAGEIKYTTAATGNKTSYFLVQGGTNKTALTVNPARLKNGVADPAFSATASTVAGKTWIYYDDQWQCWTQDEYCFYRDASNNPYAKPNGYVALNKQEADVDDASLIHDAATGTRGFIWDENCYWWEVNPTPVSEGVYKTIQPDHNGKYNYYEFNEDAWYWIKKNVTVTWNGDGVTTTNYTNVGYGTHPKWLGATPTKSGYVWDGWTIGGSGTVYTNDNLPVVTSNTTFTSHFKSNPVKYNITFKNPDGKVLDSRNWESGSTPSYEGTPEREATVDKTYTWAGTWSPAITAATAAKEYTAQYNETTRQYDVTFLDYDNTELETKKVNYNATPAYTGDPSTPTRVDPTDTYIYEFSGWKNQQTGTSGLAAVKGDQTYVAQYNHHQKWFNIRFVDYNGTTLQTGPVLRNTMPTPPADPIRESDAQYDYTFNAWSPAIATATANATYTATYNTTLRSYTIRFLNYDGDVLQTETLNYGVTPEYKGETPTNADESLEFVGWDDVMRSVSSNKDYIAQYTKKTYTVTVTSAGNGSVSGSGTYTHGETATLTASPDEGYVFSQWNDGNTSNPRSLIVTETATYTATFVSDETGNLLDIVGATATSLTINANPLTLSKWPYTINGTSYGRDGKPGPDEQCNADRTITITHDKDADAELPITVLDKNGVLVSRHKYTIPHVYSSDATLSGTDANSIVFINGGTLTINGNQSAKAIYVAAGAELKVAGSLNVEKLVLRTSPWAAAILTNNGTINATNTYYSRVVADNSKFYQFGLPGASTTTGVIMSDGSTPSATSWQMKIYSEANRAENGISETGANWETLSGTAIYGGKGYEIYSGSKYYREYYFPVNISEGETVSVQHTGDDAQNSGWNVVVSPKMGKYFSEPKPEDITICILQPEGGYLQEIPETIMPAVPFSYQAPEAGTLTFGSSLTFTPAVSPAPRRRVQAAKEETRIQWIHLDILNADGEGDQTSIYSHPTRYEQTYKTGIDVAKQSLTASRAIIYSSHAYGDMAFAGVADSLLESGVALTVYSPAAQELTFSLRDNDWLNRMESVWLIDKEEGVRIDLLNGYYTFNASEGTTRGRFFIQGQFKAPQVATELEPTSDSSLKGREIRKVIINQKMFIEVNGRLYDATGKEVKR